VPEKTGTSPLASGRVVAALSTANELGSSLQTVNALVAMLLGLLKVTHSPDAFALAMMDAADIARDAGVTQDEWARVGKIIQRRYGAEQSKNPLHGMF